ncbi:MAG: class I SAM-dependent methyltransferase family protein [archaeon]
MTLKQVLGPVLTKKELSIAPTSFDIVGDIMIFADFPKELEKKQKKIGEAIIKNFKNVGVVCKKVRKYGGQFRTPILRIIAGERRKETLCMENGARIKLHVEKCYFSTRLSNERKRIYQLVKPGERILVMFSGVAPYPLVIAKNTKAKEIAGVEKNPAAHKYAEENVKLNKAPNIRLFCGDVRDIVPKLGKFDRILMPLPKGAEKYLDVAKKASKRGTVVHFYDFLNERDFELAEKKIRKSFKRAESLGLVKCGQYGPGVFRVCLDFASP